MMTNYFPDPGPEGLQRLLTVLSQSAELPGYRDRFRKAGLEFSGGVPLLDWRALAPRFRELEILHRHEVRAEPSRFLRKPADLAYSGMTSGTRSERYIYFAGSEWNRVRLVCRAQTLKMWGVSEETRIINIASRLHYAGVRDVSLVGPLDEIMLRTLRSLLDQAPAALRGYPGRLAQLADLWKKRGFRTEPGQIRCIFSTGEFLYEFQKHLLEEVFQAPVANEYGCHETGISGISCPEYGQIHVHARRGFYETVDNLLVVTDLYNDVMPMIRYSCGDMAELEGESCSCGRPGPVIRVLGRKEDRIRTLRGSAFSGEIPMPRLKGIGSYCMERRGDDEVTVFAFLGDPSPAGEEAALQSLESWVSRNFGPMELSVCWTNGADEEETQDKSMGLPEFYHDLNAFHDRIARQPWTEELFTGQIPVMTADGADGSCRQNLLAEAAYTFRATVSPRLYSGGATETPEITGGLEKWLGDLASHDCKTRLHAARIAAFAATRLIINLGPGKVEKLMLLVRDALLSAILDSQAENLEDDLENARTDLAILEHITAPAALPSLAPSQDYQDRRPLDILSLQHLLIALETAWIHGKRNYKLRVYKRIGHLPCVLIGDLHFFRQDFGDWLLMSWRRLLGLPLPVDPVWEDSGAGSGNVFRNAWLELRRCFSQPERCAASTPMILETAAQSPAEKERALIEGAYWAMMWEQPLDAELWKARLADSPMISPDPKTPVAVESFALTPIMKALAPVLYENGDVAPAYRCLTSAFTPSSVMSSFDRVSRGVNEKQFMLSDLNSGDAEPAVGVGEVGG